MYAKIFRFHVPGIHICHTRLQMKWLARIVLLLAYTLEGLPRIHRKVIESNEKQPNSSHISLYMAVISYLALSYKHLSRF